MLIIAAFLISIGMAGCRQAVTTPENQPSHQAWYEKGLLLHYLDKHPEAIKAFDQALTLEPRCKGSWCQKGNILYELGRHQEAINAYDTALKIDPKDKYTLVSKAFALEDLGQFPEAVTACDAALQIDPYDADTWFNRASLCSRMKQRLETLRSLVNTISFAPDYQDLARKCECFRWLREDEEFKKIVTSN